MPLSFSDFANKTFAQLAKEKEQKDKEEHSSSGGGLGAAGVQAATDQAVADALAAHTAAQAVIDAAQDATQAAEEALDVQQEAATDAEQAAQDAAIATVQANVITNANNIATLQADMAERQRIDGQILTGQEEHIAGSLALPGMAIGSRSSGFRMNTVDSSMRQVIGAADAVQVHKGGTGNFTQSVFGGGGFGGAYRVLDSNNAFSAGLQAATVMDESWNLRLPPDAPEQHQVIEATSTITSQWAWGARKVFEEQGACNMFFGGNGFTGNVEDVLTGGLSNLSYDAAENAFLMEGTAATTVYGLNRFTIQSDKAIEISAQVKGSGAANNFYTGLQTFDANGDPIDVTGHRARAGTETTLTAPFSPGDSVISVVDASAWLDIVVGQAAPWTRGIAMASPTGVMHGQVVTTNALYAPNFLAMFASDLALFGGGYTVDTVANTITFASPMAAGKLFVNGTETWPIGTVIRQAPSRATFLYTELNQPSGTEWAVHADSLPVLANNAQGYAITEATKQARFLVLPHRNTGGLSGTTHMRQITVSQC